MILDDLDDLEDLDDLVDDADGLDLDDLDRGLSNACNLFRHSFRFGSVLLCTLLYTGRLPRIWSHASEGGARMDVPPFGLERGARGCRCRVRVVGEADRGNMHVSVDSKQLPQL